MFQTDYDRAPDLVMVQDKAGRAGPGRTRPASPSGGRGMISDTAAAILDAGPIAMAPGWWAFCAEARAAETGAAGACV